MASNNELLGSGKVSTKKKKVESEDFYPTWLYHTDRPEGQIVKTQADFNKLIKKGWVDSPVKLYEEITEEEEEEKEAEKAKVSEEEVKKLFK